MAETITQANRLMQLSTPAGDDVLLIHNFTGYEAVSRPFRYVLELVADVMNNMPAQVQPHNLVGQMFTLNITLDGSDSPRVITGFCESFSTGAVDDEFAHYTAVLVPWFSFLNLSSNIRFFQKQTVPQIVAKVIADAGYSSKFQDNTTKEYTSWDYCTQYRETDFSFVSRILEAEGIYYYFAPDEQEGHKLVIADATSCYNNLPNLSSFKYSPITGIQDLEDTIRVWASEERIHTGKWTVRDYHHEMTTNNLESSEPSTQVASAGQSFEMYDFAAEYAKKFNDPASRLADVKPEGSKISTVKMLAEETTRVECSGVSRCRAFNTGYKITVTGGAAAGSYLLTEVTHQGYQQPAYRNRDEVPDAYSNTFKCIDASVVYVPRAATPKPLVYGLQTAVVATDSSGEEIWPDKYGRVKVIFPWDRTGTNSLWLRVAQPWAGNSWGQQWLPRVGDEVVVSFLEGDPDHPIVVGSVYNATNMPIFALPDNKTQSGIQTHSSKGGGSSDYNMLRFEDKQGSEEIYVQAQKDWNSLIKNDETRTVKNNRTTTIHVDESRTVETGNDTISVQQGKRTITVSQDISETSQQGNISVTAQTGNISTTANQGNISTTADMGNISTTASMGNISETADLGNITIEASVGSIKISGLSGVTISCGASSISMTPASISISAPMVLINS
ncbi:MAG TPA: type VI secretion system tip protein TssI/VgrG [Bryobacteraceae bacterium]|nr:type VI secretion system tip protein TssI/VgrG [Bryobacteraceae bacterium]